ncbi:MAG: hypothetical protein Q4P28_05055, partial [Tissierellia bacterium]|nr:hypothetical protein [Tissierellia bacterium]
GKPLIVSEIGGAKGGGSELTEYAKALLKIYEESEKVLSETLNQLNDKYRDWEKDVLNDK